MVLPTEKQEECIYYICSTLELIKPTIITRGDASNFLSKYMDESIRVRKIQRRERKMRLEKKYGK